MWTKLPSLNKATAGDEGGKGIMYSLAFPTAAVSTPANTVAKLLGLKEPAKEAITPGRAVPAAQPHTELTTTKVVPFNSKVFATSSAECKAENPAATNCASIGAVNSCGYISISLNVKLYELQRYTLKTNCNFRY
jgi:hypothetical protein